MDKNTLTFCKSYQEKLKNDKDIKETKVPFWQDYRKRISLVVNLVESTPFITTLPRSGRALFTLDEEDLNYFWNKYSKYLEEELFLEIENLQKKYTEVLYNKDKL